LNAEPDANRQRAESQQGVFKPEIPDDAGFCKFQKPGQLQVAYPAYFALNCSFIEFLVKSRPDSWFGHSDSATPSAFVVFDMPASPPCPGRPDTGSEPFEVGDERAPSVPTKPLETPGLSPRPAAGRCALSRQPLTPVPIVEAA